MGLDEGGGSPRPAPEGLAPGLLDDLLCGEEERALAAAEALAAAGEAALPALASLLDSENPDLRWWASAALGMSPAEGAAPLLLRALTDPDPDVRQCAALGLRIHPQPEAISQLAQGLESDDPLFARLCGDALIALGDAALPALIKATQSPLAQARAQAARALARIEHPETVPALFDLIDDPSPQVQFWVESGLEKKGVGMVFFPP